MLLLDELESDGITTVVRVCIDYTEIYRLEQWMLQCCTRWLMNDRKWNILGITTCAVWCYCLLSCFVLFDVFRFQFYSKKKNKTKRKKKMLKQKPKVDTRCFMRVVSLYVYLVRAVGFSFSLLTICTNPSTHIISRSRLFNLYVWLQILVFFLNLPH